MSPEELILPRLGGSQVSWNRWKAGPIDATFLQT